MDPVLTTKILLYELNVYIRIKGTSWKQGFCLFTDKKWCCRLALVTEKLIERDNTVSINKNIEWFWVNEMSGEIFLLVNLTCKATKNYPQETLLRFLGMWSWNEVRYKLSRVALGTRMDFSIYRLRLRS